jgi:UDP-N-acetylglucosamine acyltransferase
MVVKDVLPYVLVSGEPAEPCGLNSIGLQRRGFSPEALVALKRAYKIIFRQGLTTQEALAQLHEMVLEHPEIKLFISAIERAERGILR